jgi:CubicO group peptidase (beta-lactamase class C family)
MRKSRLIIVITLAACAALAWLGAPIYGFKAHQGKLPLSPFGWVVLPAEAQSQSRLDDPDYAQAGNIALEILRRHRAKIAAPALTAAVAVQGQLVWSGAVGWEDVERQRAATPATVFRIGSTSKAVTATVLARLYERGVVDLDTPIDAYLSSLPNEAWRAITLRQLASHQSGLPHYKENTDLVGLYRSIALRRQFDDVRDAVSVFDDSELLFAPGQGFHYSTLGTVLLAATMAHATDKSYRTLVAQEITQPLGLDSIAEAPPSAAGHADHAIPYFSDGHRLRPWRDVNLSHRLPGGGFAATSRDLARLGAAWLDEKYLSASTRARFWSPQVLADGQVNAQNYALGFRVGEWVSPDGKRYVHANHGGVSRGGQSWLMILPEQNISIAINTNRKTDEFADFAIVYRELLTTFDAVGRVAPGIAPN